jgi:hypothetical protein
MNLVMSISSSQSDQVKNFTRNLKHVKLVTENNLQMFLEETHNIEETSLEMF